MEKMKEMLVIVIGLVVIAMLGKGIQAMDEQAKNNAIERCGGKSNVVEKYTNQGDRYYSCKVEK